MAIFFDAPVSPDALTAFVRRVPTPLEYQFSLRILRPRLVRSNKVNWAEITRKNRTARYRAFDGRIHVSERDAPGGGEVNLPPLSTSFSTGEYERLKLYQAALGGGNTAAFADAIYDDAEAGTGEVLSRLEQAAGDVLLDGAFTLNEGGLNGIAANYGVPAGNFPVAAIAWSSVATATPVTNIRAWVAVYTAVNGFAPGGMWMSSEYLNYLLLNAEIRNLQASLAGTPGLVTRAAVDATMQAFGLPPITGVYDVTVDVDGVSTRTWPVNKVLFHPPNMTDLGYTAMGVSATALELVNSKKAELSFNKAAGIVGIVVKEGPPFREFTFIDAVGMPVLTNPKMLMVATVGA